MDEFNLIRTDISKAYWCISDSVDSKNAFETAKIAIRDKNETYYNKISWFDRLFEGGIRIPKKLENEKDNKAVTILLTGPPGTGKSTLAMELCYRLTEEREKLTENEINEPLRSLYITNETKDDWLVKKARSFGWTNPQLRFDTKPTKTNYPKNLVYIWSTPVFGNYLNRRVNIPPFFDFILGVLGTYISTGSLSNMFGYIKRKYDDWKVRKLLKKNEPKVLVIDSLNSIETTSRDVLFSSFTKLSQFGQLVTIIILDSNTQGVYDFWEYMSDTVIRFDKSYSSNYMIRTIEILKARLQPHVWGKQQLKIYPVFNKMNKRLRLQHPYRNEGGIFIFPSIHYYLSECKRLTPAEFPKKIPTPLEGLNKVLRGGFPQGRCTGFIGCRGGHKSHLGYLQILNRIINFQEENTVQKALIISLRDDEGTAKKTMEKILAQQFNSKDPKTHLENLENTDKLEILYYPPGNITPEEFFHRMIMSIYRLKYDSNKGRKVGITVLFNSLDQLSSRFPLCAKEDIFIPGIIEKFMSEEITSIFIAAQEPGQPPQQYGLLSMADLILSFDHKLFSKDAYLGHINEAIESNLRNEDERSNFQSVKNEVRSNIGNYQEAIVLKTIRFAGGQSAGSGGILDLLDEESALYKYYNSEGLYFFRFSNKYSKNIFIDDDLNKSRNKNIETTET